MRGKGFPLIFWSIPSIQKMRGKVFLSFLKFTSSIQKMRGKGFPLIFLIYPLYSKNERKGFSSHFLSLPPLFKKWEERVFLSFFEFISSNLTEKNCQIRGTGNSYFFNFRTSICVFNVFSGMSLLSIGLGGNRIYWPRPLH